MISDDEATRLRSAFAEVNRRLQESDKKILALEATTQTLLGKILSMQYTVTNLIAKSGQ
jgi:hypothetical protein